jgi:hypothetical protein
MVLAKKRPGECNFKIVIGYLQTPNIYKTVIKFCESVNPLNPGNGSFKLSMLCKEMNNLVLKFYKEKNPLVFVHNHSK